MIKMSLRAAVNLLLVATLGVGFIEGAMLRELLNGSAPLDDRIVAIVGPTGLILAAFRIHTAFRWPNAKGP